MEYIDIRDLLPIAESEYNDDLYQDKEGRFFKWQKYMASRKRYTDDVIIRRQSTHLEELKKEVKRKIRWNENGWKSKGGREKCAGVPFYDSDPKKLLQLIESCDTLDELERKLWPNFNKDNNITKFLNEDTETRHKTKKEKLRELQEQLKNDPKFKKMIHKQWCKIKRNRKLIGETEKEYTEKQMKEYATKLYLRQKKKLTNH